MKVPNHAPNSKLSIKQHVQRQNLWMFLHYAFSKILLNLFKLHQFKALKQTVVYLILKKKTFLYEPNFNGVFTFLIRKLDNSSTFVPDLSMNSKDIDSIIEVPGLLLN